LREKVRADVLDDLVGLGSRKVLGLLFQELLGVGAVLKLINAVSISYHEDLTRERVLTGQ